MATVYYTATTLDGFIASPEHSLEWLFEVDTGDLDSYGPFFAGVGAMAMGSSTYRWLLGAEPFLERPGTWQDGFGDRPTWVFTSQTQTAVPGADIRFTQAPVAQVHAEMQAAAGDRDLWLMGGGDLVGQFADAGLLDRLVLGYVPVTLGEGAPVMPRFLRSDRLRLTDVQRSGQLVLLTYDVSVGRG